MRRGRREAPPGAVATARGRRDGAFVSPPPRSYSRVMSTWIPANPRGRMRARGDGSSAVVVPVARLRGVGSLRFSRSHEASGLPLLWWAQRQESERECNRVTSAIGFGLVRRAMFAAWIELPLEEAAA